MDNDEFIAAINDRPRSQTLKLVYADWLEESGNPKAAEYLRLECELSQQSLFEDRYWDLKNHYDPNSPRIGWMNLPLGKFTGSARTAGCQLWQYHRKIAVA